MTVPIVLENASAALRAFHDRKALEEMFGVTMRRRGKGVEPAKERRGGANKWRSPIDLRNPAPRSVRPGNMAGATSFHFRQTAINKTRSVSNGSNSATPNPVMRFERYASEAAKVDYVSAALAERYLRMPKGLGRSLETASRAALVASNISLDPIEREAFWTAAWAAASTPGIPTVELRPNACTESDWYGLYNDLATPDAVAQVAAQIGREFAQAGANAVTGRVRKVRLDDPKAITWAAGLWKRFGDKKRSARMLHYVEPRGGRVQLRLEVELPVEFTREDRCAIIAAIAADLDRIQVRYTIVAHAPDHSNDGRNEHLHILIFPGICAQRDDGRWDFKVSRKLRPGEIALALGEVPARKMRKRASQDIMSLRVRYEHHCNARLKQLGVARRLDARTYQAMGINQDPQEHLGSAAAAQVAAGLDIDIDRANTIKSWAPAFRNVRNQAVAERERYAGVMRDLERALLRNPALADDGVAALGSRYLEVAGDVCETSEALARFELEREMVRSGADRLLRKTTRLLQAIDEGSAKADDVKNVRLIKARRELAEDHLAEIDRAAAPWDRGIQLIPGKVREGRKLLRELEHQIGAAIAAREQLTRDRDAGPTLLQEAEPALILSVLAPTLDAENLKPHVYVNALIEHLQNQSKADAAVDRRSLIMIYRKSPGGSAVACSGLGTRDAAAVEQEPYKSRFDAALIKACVRQEQNIGRVLKFIAKNGETELRDPDSSVHSTIARYYQLYQDHPHFLREIEEARRAFKFGLQPGAGLSELDEPDRLAASDTRALRDDKPMKIIEPASVAPVPEVQNDTLPTGPEIDRGSDRDEASGIIDVMPTASPANDLNPTVPVPAAPIDRDVDVDQLQPFAISGGHLEPLSRINEGTHLNARGPGQATPPNEPIVHAEKGSKAASPAAPGPELTAPVSDVESVAEAVFAARKLAAAKQLHLVRGEAAKRARAPNEMPATLLPLPTAGVLISPEPASAGEQVKSTGPSDPKSPELASPSLDSRLAQARQIVLADERYRRLSRSDRRSLLNDLDGITEQFEHSRLRLFEIHGTLFADGVQIFVTSIKRIAETSLGFDAIRAVAAEFAWQQPGALDESVAIRCPGAGSDVGDNQLAANFVNQAGKRGIGVD